MNGEHKEIFEKLQSIEIQLAEIKKDTAYMITSVSEQKIHCQTVTSGFDKKFVIMADKIINLEKFDVKLAAVAATLGVMGGVVGSYIAWVL